MVKGRATFTVDGETVDAPAGTFVFVHDPAAKRRAVAEEDQTSVLVVGGAPGEVYTPPHWERSAPALGYFATKEYDKAHEALMEAHEEFPDDATVLFNLACAESLLGRTDDALGHLEQSIANDESFRELARTDTDFDRSVTSPGSRSSSASRRRPRRIHSSPAARARSRSSRRRRGLDFGRRAATAVVVVRPSPGRRRRCVVVVSSCALVARLRLGRREIVVGADARHRESDGVTRDQVTGEREPGSEDESSRITNAKRMGQARRGRVKPRPIPCSGFAKRLRSPGSEPPPERRPPADSQSGPSRPTGERASPQARDRGRCRPGLLRCPREPLEDTLFLSRREPGPLVQDDEIHVAALTAAFDADRAPSV